MAVLSQMSQNITTMARFSVAPLPLLGLDSMSVDCFSLFFFCSCSCSCCCFTGCFPGLSPELLLSFVCATGATGAVDAAVGGAAAAACCNWVWAAPICAAIAACWATICSCSAVTCCCAASCAGDGPASCSGCVGVVGGSSCSGGCTAAIAEALPAPLAAATKTGPENAVAGSPVDVSA